MKNLTYAEFKEILKNGKIFYRDYYDALSMIASSVYADYERYRDAGIEDKANESLEKFRYLYKKLEDSGYYDELLNRIAEYKEGDYDAE